jgi:hypothetical protein
MARRVALQGFGAFLAAIVIPASGALAQPLTPFAIEVLAAHNVARAAVGAPALRWDETLAVHASQYAHELARMRQLLHSPRASRGAERENLAQAPASYSASQVVGLWTGERRYFVPGMFPNVSSTGNWYDVSHYTQVIWPTTTRVGCGLARAGAFNFVVCRYLPGGNQNGKPVGIPRYRPERGR